MPELPTSLTQPQKEPVIFTIPEQFYGMAAKANLPKMAPAPASVPPPTMPGVPAPPPTPPKPKAKESKKWLLIPILALIFLALMGFAAWWFLQPKAPPASPTPSVTLPAAATQPEPQPEPAPQPQPEPATTTVETPAAPAPEADDDADGLTNAEEALYGTNPNNADSDADGFSDSVEVINLYNPAGFKPTKLIEAGLVKTASLSEGPWEILIPTSWTASPSGSGVMTIQTSADQRMTITEHENPDGATPLNYYLNENPGSSPAEVTSFTTKSGLAGVASPDRKTAMIALDGKIYSIGMSDASGQPLASGGLFPATYQMILNSFSKKP